MKKWLAIAGMSCILGVTTMATVFSTVAWFKFNANLDAGLINGSTEGSYFAYGNGTSTRPFGINKPRHLYNLAWLNMRGYFEDKDNNNDGNRNDVFYFEIDPTIENGILDGTLADGSLTTIPPIGTEEHPFYGNFNGNGKVISNFIISADSGDYEQRPYNMEDFFTTPQIVGLFGVIGEIDGEIIVFILFLR